MKFVLINSIFYYIITGYLNSDNLIRELRDEFHSESAEAKILKELCNPYACQMDFVTFDKKLEQLISYLNEGCCTFQEILTAYSTLKYYYEDVYKQKWIFGDIQKIINDSFSRTKEREKEGSLKDPDFPTPLEENGDEFLRCIHKRIRDEYINQQRVSVQDFLKTYFRLISNNSNEFENFSYRYDPKNIFSNFQELDIFDKIMEMNNIGIIRFTSIIRLEIIRIKNAGDDRNHEMESISAIAQEIEKKLVEKPEDFDPMRTFNFKKLIGIVHDEIKKLGYAQNSNIQIS